MGSKLVFIQGSLSQVWPTPPRDFILQSRFSKIKSILSFIRRNHEAWVLQHSIGSFIMENLNEVLTNIVNLFQE